MVRWIRREPLSKRFFFFILKKREKKHEFIFDIISDRSARVRFK